MSKFLKKVVFIIPFLCLCTGLFAQNDSLFKIPYPERYEAVNFYVGSLADSATDFRNAKVLLNAARKRNNERDVLCVEQAILHLEQKWDVDTAHMEQRGAELILRAEKINCHPVIAFVYTILGDYNYNKRHNYSLAFQYLLTAYNDYNNLYKNEFPDMSRTQYPLALAYYKFYDYKNSLRYSKELLQHDLTNSVWLEILIDDLIGMSYIKLEQYDSSIVYFQKVLELAPKHHDSTNAIAWKGIATGNIGMAWYLQKQYDKAIPYLTTGEEISTRGGVMDNTASFAVYLANIYLDRKDMAAAEKQLQIARAASYQSNDIQNYNDLYTALSAFYRQKGDAPMTLKYQDSSLRFKDSLAAILDVNKKYSAEIAAADERRAMNEKLATKEEEKQILLRNSSIVLSLMALLSVLLFYNRKLLKQQHRREQLLADKQIAETELMNARRLLEDFTKNITEKNELIESMKERTSGQVSPDVLLQLQQSSLLTDEQWENFRELFEKAYSGYLIRLKEKMPGLTPAETRFMALCKLKLSNKEMSAMLGNSTDAIRQYRSRLRKKFNIPEEKSMEELAETI